MSCSVARELLERLSLEVRVLAVDVVEDLRLEDEEAAVDPALAELRLLGELDHLVAVELDVAEARGWRTAVSVASFPWAR